MAYNLRKKNKIHYYEPGEPRFDEYVFCDECCEFVYEYCSVHGSLLVIPDDKVPSENILPSYVPRAAFTVPIEFLHLAPSKIPGAGIGVFSSVSLPRGVRFGPYLGVKTQSAESVYCWQIYETDNRVSHVTDASDGDAANWLRYVSCARHWREQNLLAYQYCGRVYYRTIKPIPPFTELLVYCGTKFANTLGVDLGKYNRDQCYNSIIKQNKTLEVIKPNISIDNNITCNKPSLEIEKIDQIPDENSEQITNNNSMETTLGHIFDNSFDQTFDQITESIETNSEKTFNFGGTSEINSDGISNNKFNQEYNFNNLKFIEGSFGDTENANFNNYSNILTNNVSDSNTPILNPITRDDSGTPTCHICQKTFKKLKYLKDHLFNVHANPGVHACQKCNFKTNRKNSLVRHLNTKKCNNYIYSENLSTDSKQHACNLTFQNVATIKKDKQDGENKTKSYFAVPRECTICDFKTDSRKSFYTHKSKHANKNYACTKCDYRTYLRERYNRHIKKWGHNATNE